ncbi:MAG: cyclin-domain-containing protein [Benjaminiella poitrasii]|nr:MAG: cyclin-domain-containing protein [Benjaminiella poitrasii]
MSKQPTARYQLNIIQYPILTLVRIVADLLNSIIETNDMLLVDSNNSTVTHFHSRTVPNIDIYTYLLRILKFTPFTNEVLICLLIYFDRIANEEGTRNYAVSSLTVHRLLITSIVVATKFTSDVFYPNTRYAKVGGIPLYELNQLELEFLFLCNFNLHVKLEEMQTYGDQLLTHAIMQQQGTTTLSTAIPLVSPPISPLDIPVPFSSSRKRKEESNNDTRNIKKKGPSTKVELLISPSSSTADAISH